MKENEEIAEAAPQAELEAFLAQPKSRIWAPAVVGLSFMAGALVILQLQAPFPASALVGLAVGIALLLTVEFVRIQRRLDAAIQLLLLTRQRIPNEG